MMQRGRAFSKFVVGMACVFMIGVGSARETAAAGIVPKGCYFVNRTEGTVLRWNNRKARWYNVQKNSCLSSGTLVEVFEKSLIAMTGDPALIRSDAAEAKSFFVQMDKPMIFRLSPSIFRRMKLGKQFISDDDLKVAEQSVMESAVASLKEAWRKTALLAVRPDQVGITTVGSDITLGIHSYPLYVLYPTDQLFIYRDNYPSTVVVIWREIPENKDNKYYVYLWPKTDQKKSPVAVASGGYHYIPVPKPGSYYLQVTSADGKYQSIPRFIYITEQIDLAANWKDNDGTENDQIITTTKPSRDFTYVTEESSVLTYFEWQSPRCTTCLNADDFIYKLVITKNGDKKPFAEIKTKETHAALPLDAASYEWTVETAFSLPNNKFADILSPLNKISIISNVGDSGDKILNRILEGGSFKTDVIYLNSPG